MRTIAPSPVQHHPQDGFVPVLECCDKALTVPRETPRRLGGVYESENPKSAGPREWVAAIIEDGRLAFFALPSGLFRGQESHDVLCCPSVGFVLIAERRGATSRACRCQVADGLT